MRGGERERERGSEAVGVDTHRRQEFTLETFIYAYPNITYPNLPTANALLEKIYQ